MVSALRTLSALLIALLLGATAVPAQLVIDQKSSGLSPYPSVEEQRRALEEARKAEEEPEVEPAPIYTGDPVQLPISCDPDALISAGLVCNASSPCDLTLEPLAVTEIELDDAERLVVGGAVRAPGGTLESFLLVSSDGGATWAETAPRLSVGSVESLQFLEDGVGFAAGQRSMAGVAPETFLLYTDDAGENFDVRVVKAGPEPEKGYIVDLRFDTKEHGYLILERPQAKDPFRLYETYNAGRSWSTRQIVAERPPLPGARRRSVVSSDLRWSQADGLWEVQQRQGADWAVLARFAADLGRCPASSASE